MPFDALPDRIVSDLIKLRMARDGIAGSGWRTLALGLPEDAKHCLIGWMLKVTDYDETEATRLVVSYLYPALPKAPKGKTRISAVYDFNDRQRTSKPILAVMDRAIDLAV